MFFLHIAKCFSCGRIKSVFILTKNCRNKYLFLEISNRNYNQIVPTKEKMPSSTLWFLHGDGMKIVRVKLFYFSTVQKTHFKRLFLLWWNNCPQRGMKLTAGL